MKRYIYSSQDSDFDVNTLYGPESYSWVNRCSFGSNPNSSPELLELLGYDPNNYVRSAVAQNPNTPVSVLRTMLSDPDLSVAYDAAMSDKISEDERYVTLCDIQSKYFDPGVMSTARCMDYDELLINICKNSNISMTTARRMIEEDGLETVAFALSENPNTPPELLSEIAMALGTKGIHDYRDIDVSNYEFLARNPNTPVAVLQDIANMVNYDPDLADASNYAKANPNYVEPEDEL